MGVGRGGWEGRWGGIRGGGAQGEKKVVRIEDKGYGGG